MRGFQVGKELGKKRWPSTKGVTVLPLVASATPVFSHVCITFKRQACILDSVQSEEMALAAAADSPDKIMSERISIISVHVPTRHHIHCHGSQLAKSKDIEKQIPTR